MVIWLTGLSGSGKTTIARAIKEKLEAEGKSVELLDGDTVREKLHTDLDFSREGVRENNRRIAEFAKKQASSFDVVLVSVISPYREDRASNREIIGDGYKEVFVNCPLEECIRRDVKGHYKKALAGEIENFIGVSPDAPYESPENPEMELQTGKCSLDECVGKIYDFLSSQISIKQK